MLSFFKAAGSRLYEAIQALGSQPSYSLEDVSYEDLLNWFLHIENLYALQAWQSGLYPSLKNAQEEASILFKQVTDPLDDVEKFKKWSQSQFAFHIVIKGQKRGRFWYSYSFGSYGLSSLSKSPQLENAFIEALELDPLYRGQGIGSSILKDLEKCFKEVGVPFIRLHAFRHNIQAISFYKRLGYVLEASDEYSVYMKKELKRV